MGDVIKALKQRLRMVGVANHKGRIEEMKKSARLMITASLLALIAAPALAASATGKGSNPNGKPFVTIAGQILEVEGKVSTLQDQVDSLVRKVETIEDRILANEEAIDSLIAQNEALEAQLNANGDDIDAIKAKIAALEAANATLQAKINANSGNIADLQAQLATNNGLIAAMQQSISALGSSLQAQINHNNSLIDYLFSEVNRINSVLSRKQDIMRGVCPTGQTLRYIYPDGSIACEAASSGINGVYANYIYNYQQAYPYSSFGGYVSCPSGMTLTGGGYDNYGMNTYSAYPYGGSFNTYGYNPNPYYNYNVNFAVCLGTYR